MNKLFVTFLTLLMLTGCQILPTNTNSNEKASVSPEITSQVKIRQVTGLRTENDLLRVSVFAESSFVGVKDYYFRISWLDKDGHEVKGLSSRWEAIVSTGLDDAMIINRTASDPEAVDYRVLISGQPGK